MQAANFNQLFNGVIHRLLGRRVEAAADEFVQIVGQVEEAHPQDNVPERGPQQFGDGVVRHLQCTSAGSGREDARRCGGVR